MNKLTNEQLEKLVEKRNAKGFKHTVEVMSNEELAAYRINCVEAIERLTNQMARAKQGGSVQHVLIENKEVLEGYVFYIDVVLSEQASTEQKNGLAVIDEFLEQWKEKAFKYYTNKYKEYRQIRSGNFEITEESLKSVNKNSWSNERKYSDERIKKILEELPVMSDLIKDQIANTIRHSKFGEWKQDVTKHEMFIFENMFREGYLEEVLKQDAEARRKKLIAKVEAKAGKIVDAKGLKFGDNGDINGKIIGDKETVSVRTIYAGGYNVQCLHYRVLVNVFK